MKYSINVENMEVKVWWLFDPTDIRRCTSWNGPGGGANRKLDPLLVFELLLNGSSFHPTLPNISNIDPAAVKTKTDRSRNDHKERQRLKDTSALALLPHPGSLQALQHSNQGNY